MRLRMSASNWMILLVCLCALGMFLLNGCASRGSYNSNLHSFSPPPPYVDPLLAYMIYGVLVGTLGVAVGVALFIWLPFKRLAISVCGGSLGLIATCLLVRSVLPYIGWIVLALFAIAAVVAIINGRKLIAKLTEAWNHVPDNAPTSAALDAFMGKIVKEAQPFAALRSVTISQPPATQTMP